jgi:hypothetical protein
MWESDAHILKSVRRLGFKPLSWLLSVCLGIRTVEHRAAAQYVA